MAAELGTMRVTEQLDAMVTLRTDPYRYLVAPRVLASTIALPLLVLVANSIGIFGGWLLATAKLGFNSSNYLSVTREFLEMDDLVMSLVKAGVFGFDIRSEEHTSELQSLMRISYAVFCLKKKNKKREYK